MTLTEQPANSLANYKPMLKERGELAVLKKQVEERIKELDEAIRPALEGRGEIVAEGYSFKCTMSAGRKSIDKDALNGFLKEYSMDFTDFEKEGAPFTTMTVKAVNAI